MRTHKAGPCALLLKPVVPHKDVMYLFHLTAPEIAGKHIRVEPIKETSSFCRTVSAVCFVLFLVQQGSSLAIDEPSISRSYFRVPLRTHQFRDTLLEETPARFDGAQALLLF